MRGVVDTVAKLCLAGVLVAVSSSWPGAGAAAKTIEDELTAFPVIPVNGCRGGRARLYDECGSQVDLFEQALAAAVRENKVLLVSYGAEWCIWCHVFHSYVTGVHTAFLHRFPDAADTETYTALLYERASSDPAGAAIELAAFVRNKFVLVHIDDQHARDGDKVLQLTDAEEHYNWELPFIFSVTSEGRFAAGLPSAIQTRRDTDDWFRGYDRVGLMQELMRLHEAANGQSVK